MTQFYPELNDELIIRFLLEETTDDEKVFISQEIERNPAFRDEIQKFGHVLDMVELTTVDTAKAWNKVRTRHHSTQQVFIAPQKRMLYSLRKLAVAASVIIIIGIASFFGYQSFMSTTMLTVANEEPVDITLKDGSVITLNRVSELEYPRRFAKNNRTVHLKGEAFFDVTHTDNKPFIIEANDLTVTVIGTSFYVRAFPGMNPEVTVETGKVKCEYFPTQETIYLEAGETATFGQKEQTKRRTNVHDLNTYAWKTYSLRFENEPFDNIVYHVNKAYGSNIEIEDNIKDCRLTVNFNNLNIEGVLNVLQSILDVKYIKTKDKIILKGKGC